ncbi:MAG: helix-turn-helix domain-containing protein [Xanthobacteraceae bacterium]|nr:helix-turn-helix domain-containing protein [Xanthobacteraceae bacterium]
MAKKDLEIVRGSGNVFRDFGRPNADLEQARAILAARIIKALDERKLTARAAEKLTGVAHTDLSRIRNAKLERFTLDRMITILGKLDEDIEVSIDVRPRAAHHASVPAT